MSALTISTFAAFFPFRQQLLTLQVLAAKHFS
jgi:hypothetical protein